MPNGSSADAGIRALLEGRLLLHQVELSGVRATLRQDADSTFNFDFLIAAFATNEPETDAPSDTTGGFALDIRSVHLERILFTMDLRPSELGMRVDLGTLAVSLDGTAIDPLRFHLDAIELRNTTVDLRTVGGEPEAPSYPELTNPLADIDVRFRTIRLENVRSSITTVNTGDSLWVAVDHSTINAKEIDASVQRWHLANVDLDGFRLGTLSKSNSVEADTNESEPPWLDQHDGFRYWTQDWDLALDRLTVTNSSLAFHTDSISSPTLLLDPDHVAFSDIGSDARDIIVGNDRIRMSLDRLRIHGGPENDTIEAGFALDARPSSFLLEKGRLSVEGNSVDFVFKAWPEDLAQVYRDPQLIPMHVEADAELRMADLVPVLDRSGVQLPAASATNERWSTKLWLKGSVERIEDIGIALDGDQGSVLHANGSATNILQWPSSDHDLIVEELTLGRGMAEVTKAFAPPGTPLPGRLTLRGEVHGHGYDLNTRFDLRSDLGDLAGQAAIQDVQGFLPDHVDLDLKAEHIAMARITGDTAMGPLGFVLVTKATGLTGPTPIGSMTFRPTELTYNGNDLSSLGLEVNAVQDSLHLDLFCDAPAAEMHLKTSGPYPGPMDSLRFGYDLNVQRLQFGELGLTGHELDLEGTITGTLEVQRNGGGGLYLNAPGFRVFNAQQGYAFEHLEFLGSMDQDSTDMELDCDVAHVTYRANMSLDSTISLLRERLLGSFQEPYSFVPPPGRIIRLNADLSRNDLLTNLLVPDLRGLDVERIEGSYHADGDSLRSTVDIPLVDHTAFQVSDLHMNLDAVGPLLNGEIAVKRVQRDSLRLDDLLLQANNAPGKLVTVLRLLDGDHDRYRIGADLGRDQGIPILHLQDDLVLDEHRWTALEENALYFDPSGLRAKDMLLTSGSQRIELTTTDEGNHLRISGFDLSNITGLIRDEDSLAMAQGTLDASILIPAQGGAGIEADVEFMDLEFLDVSFGTVKAHVEEKSKDHYTGSLDLAMSSDHVRIDVDADVGGEETRIIADGDLDLRDLSQFLPLVDDQLFELGGALTGELRFEQIGNTVAVLGEATFTDARVGLIQTGAVYRLDQETVTFDRQGLMLRDVTVLDAKDNRFELDGRVNTGVGEEPALDLRLRTDRFQLVNSTEKENPNFFGKLFGSIDLRISGTASAPIVKGNVNVLDSTALSVVLPGSKVEMIDHAGIVEFTDRSQVPDTVANASDSQMLRDSLAAQLPRMELDLRIGLDRNASFAIVIDPTTGDAATFRGEADLKFKHDAEGDIQLQGPLTVVEGGYTLEFYGLVKKRFDLVPGGKVTLGWRPLGRAHGHQGQIQHQGGSIPLGRQCAWGAFRKRTEFLAGSAPLRCHHQHQGCGAGTEHQFRSGDGAYGKEQLPASEQRARSTRQARQ